jgi:hypothetical protein
MKKVIVLLTLLQVFITINPFQVYAQWYKSYGVNNINELTEAQCKEAMEKAAITVKGGRILTVIGGADAILGGILFSIPSTSNGNMNFKEELNADLKNLFRDVFGAVFLITGGAIAASGIPIWITGAVRKSSIRKVLAKLPAKVSLSPQIIPEIHHYAVGLSVAIRF